MWQTVVGNCHSPLDLAELLGEGDRCRGSGSGGPWFVNPLRWGFAPLVSPEERPEPPPEFKPCTAKTLMPLSTQVTQGSTANGLTEPTAAAAAHYIGGSAAMMEGLISEEGQELCCCSM